VYSSNSEITFLNTNAFFINNKTSNTVNDFYLTGSAILNVILAQNNKVEMFGGIYANDRAYINKDGKGLLMISGINYISNISSFGIIGGGRVLVDKSTFSYLGNDKGIYIEDSTLGFNASSAYFTNNINTYAKKK
jgi:hypothetical protein